MPAKARTPRSNVVKTEADAKAALLKYRAIKEDIAVRMAAAGIPDLEEQADELRQKATDWAVKNDKDTISLGGKVYARLRRDKYGGTWVATSDDLTSDTPVSVVPLRTILWNKYAKKGDKTMFNEIWHRVSRRAVDPDKLDRAVQEGVLTADEISPAFYEKDKAPFLILYGD